MMGFFANGLSEMTRKTMVVHVRQSSMRCLTCCWKRAENSDQASICHAQPLNISQNACVAHENIPGWHPKKQSNPPCWLCSVPSPQCAAKTATRLVGQCCELWTHGLQMSCFGSQPVEVGNTSIQYVKTIRQYALWT